MRAVIKRILSSSLPPMVWGMIIFTISLMPGGAGGMNLFGIPHFDKVGHFGMYGIWVFLMMMAWHPKNADGSFHFESTYIPLCLGILVGIGLEFFQLWMHQGRSFELADMVANALGAVAGWAAAWWLTKT